MAFFTINAGDHSKVIISFYEITPTDRDINMLLAELKVLLETESKLRHRLHLIYHIKVPLVLTLKQRHLIAVWIKENFNLIKITVLSTAYITAYRTHKIMIESLYFLQAPDWSVSFFKTLKEAEMWTEKKYAE